MTDPTVYTDRVAFITAIEARGWTEKAEHGDYPSEDDGDSLVLDEDGEVVGSWSQVGPNRWEGEMSNSSDEYHAWMNDQSEPVRMTTFNDRIRAVMTDAGWAFSDWAMVKDGIQIWTTDQRLLEITVDCLAAGLENDDPMPTGDVEALGSEYTIILMED